MSKRTQFIDVDLDGISYQSWPDVPKPYKVRGVIETGLSKRHVTICMTKEEAESAVVQLASLLGMRVTGVTYAKEET